MAKMTRDQFLKMIAERKAKKARGSDRAVPFGRGARGRDTASPTQTAKKF